MSTPPLYHVDSIELRYKGLERPALDQVSLEIVKGQTLGIVGESGSGKSSLARCLLGLETLSAGNIKFHGSDIAQLKHVQKKSFRRSVQMVFQDPLNSLNPRMTIGAILSEVLSVHGIVGRSDIPVRVKETLALVGLGDEIQARYPHELSGGQRQRTGIARALLLEPEVIIADEPVSALDVSVQAQILNLLADLIEKTGITLVLIAHDLAVVRYVCERIAVMKSGEIVEQGATDDVIGQPQHRYTQMLLSAVPDIDAIRGAPEPA